MGPESWSDKADRSSSDCSSRRSVWVSPLTLLTVQSLLCLSIFKLGISILESHALCEEKLERYDRPEVSRHQIRADTERANLPVDLLSRLHLHVADTTQSLSFFRSWLPQGVILGSAMFDTFSDVFDELTVHFTYDARQARLQDDTINMQSGRAKHKGPTSNIYMLEELSSSMWKA